MVKRLLQVDGICLTAVLFFLLANIQLVRADGSKDMYPADYFARYASAGVTTSNAGSYRACLLSGIPTGSDPNLASPFPTNGTLKVYAKEGEHIYMASSAMVLRNNTTKETYGKIIWRAPDGTSGSVENLRRGGLIANRSEELAGPNINGSTSGYDAYKLTVGAGQEGVWEIDFIGTTTTMNFSGETASRHKIDGWTEDTNRPYINAFDVSVSNVADDAFIKGRVYANVLNLMMPSAHNNVDFSCQWYTTFYVLTNTGYLYEVKPNGQNGHFSTFFANNKGVQTDPVGWINNNSDYSSSLAVSCYGGFASYKSLDCDVSSNNRFRDNKVPTYDPRRPDMALTRIVDGEEKTVDDITHKIFFCMPSQDMPAYARAVYGSKVDSTWLLTNLNSEDAPLISNLSLVGKESRLPGVLGPEGVDIFFEANASGDYLIEMVFGDGYANRTFAGYCEKGENVIDWDGLDGNGKRVPVVNVSLAGKLKSAEIHFPFFDLESNKNGFSLNQLNAEWTAVERDTIYWDDSSLNGVGALASGEDPLQMTTGTPSPGHKWLYNSGSNRGDKRVIDTWTFAQGASRGTQNLSAYSRYIDLGITSVTCDTSVAHVGEIVSYTLGVVNKAGGKVEYKGDSVIVDSDADSASVGVWFPRGGFVTTSIELLDSDDPTCRVARQPSSSEFGLGFISLKNGKRATLKVSGYATSALAHNYIQPIGFIMRPGDFFEVDAKNLASDGMPLNPLNEYEGIENDNVMVAVGSLFLLNTAPDALSNDTVVPAGRIVSGNVLNNDKDVDGDVLSVVGYMVNGSMGTLGDPMTIQKEGQPCGLFVLNADGSYTFTADGSYDGRVPDIYYGVSDGFTGNTTYGGEDLIPGMDTSRINIQVLPNHSPTVSPTSVSINRMGSKTWLPITISDVDGDSLVISLSGADASSFEVIGDSVFYVGSAVASETVAHFDLTVDDGVRAPVVVPISVTIKVNQAPTLSPSDVTISAKYRTAGTYLIPVVFSDPDGDKVTVSPAIGGDSPSYFSVEDNNLYFVATGGNYGNTRRLGMSTYNLRLTATDDKGVSSQLSLTVRINVTQETIEESGAYAYALDDIYYGASLSEALVYGAECDGSWNISDSVLGVIDTTTVLPAGVHSLEMLFTPVSASYQAKSVNVRFNILPRPITLESGNAEKIYDGDALSEPQVTIVSGSLLGSESFTYGNFATVISADTIENTFSYAAAAGTSLSNYNVTVRYGSLIVSPRPITLQSVSATKMFDGTPLTEPTVNVSSGSFVGVDGFSYSNFASITEVGSVENTFSYAPAPGVTLSNYAVTQEFGTLTVEPLVWTGDYDINLSGSAYLYDGTAHEPSATIEASGYVLDETFFNIRYENNVNAGDSAMAIISSKENSGVVFKTDTAFFSITKRSIVIKSASCEQTYNGSTLECHDIESVKGDSLADGDSFTASYTASLLHVGEVDNEFQVAIDERNYDVTLQYGSLKVTPRTVTLSETTVAWSDDSYEYDGQAHCPTATIIVDGIVLDASRDYTVTCSDNVQVGENTAVAHVSEKAGGDFSFSDYDAYFSITPAIVRITGRSVAEKTYDGTTSATVTLSGVTGFLSGEEVDVEASASFLDANVGTGKDVEISYSLTGSDRSNYRLEVENETYPDGVISPLEVVLSWSGGPLFAYDGLSKRVEASVTNAIGSEMVSVLTYDSNEATEVGDYVAKALSLDNDNYSLPADASYSWSIRPNFVDAEISLVDTPYEYDQTAHEPSAVVKVEGVELDASNYVVSYENNVEAGDSAMAIVSKSASGTYFFNTDTLYFSIGKRSVLFRSDSCRKVYDGSPLTCESASAVDPSRVLPGDTYSVSYTGSQTNVGVSDNTFTVVFDKDNYVVEYEFGTLRVTPKPIEIDSSDIEWNETEFVYDGEEHCPTATITVGGNVLNPLTDYRIVCENNVNVGDEVAHIAVRSQDGGNFEFTDYVVNFSIKPAVITITDSTIYEKTFDGGQTATVVVNAVSFKAPKDSIQVIATGKFANALAGKNKKVNITYQLTGPDSDNYTLAYNKVTYTKGVIYPKEVELTWSTPDTFVYDGLKHGVSAEVHTNVHVSTMYATGYEGDSAVNVGRYVARVKGVTNSNFKLPENDSLVWMIIPSGIDSSAFELQENTFTYDAMPHPVTFVADSALQFVEGVDYTISYKYRRSEGASSWTGFSPINAGIYDIKLTILNPNYENVELTGWWMSINKAPVTVSSSVVETKVYDRTLDAAVSVDGVNGVIGDEDVHALAVAQYDTFTTDASSIRVAYQIYGEDVSNYYLQDSTFVTNGSISPLLVTVEGTAVLDKSYDGTLDAVASVGSLKDVISPDVVNVSVSSAYFSSDTIGVGTDVYVTYRLSGQDAANYIVKPDTLKGNILEPAVTFAWEVEDTVYGAAVVGKNPIAQINQTLEGEISYFVDGLPVDTGYVIPAGTHSLLAQFSGEGGFVVPSGGKSIRVSRKHIVLDAYDINPTKAYDGTDSVLSLRTDSLLVGVVGTDDVRLASFSARYNNAQVGTDKTITVSMLLAGTDTANYEVGDEALPGVIRKREVKLAAGDSTKVYDGTPLVFDSVAIIGDGFIEGDLLSVHAVGNIIEPGHVLNKVVFEFANDSVVDNYEIIVARGFLVVTKIPQEMPNVTPVDESILGLNDGQLLNLTVEMEMHDENSATFEMVTRLDSLYAPGTYYIRYPEKQYYDSSETQVVVILPGRGEFLVEASSSDTVKGSAVGGGSYLYQSDVTLEAVANTGYHFVAWNDSLTDNPFTFVLTGDTSFFASFAPNRYELYVTDRGTTVDSLSILFGDTVVESMLGVTLQREGYDFAGWSPSFPIVMGAADVSVEAQWKRQMFLVDVDTLTERGRVLTSFENPVAYGDTVELTATPSEGYHFVAWNDGTTVNPYAVQVKSDTSLGALFEPNEHSLYVVSEGIALDTIPTLFGDTIYESALNLSAPLEKVGHLFAGWSPAFPVVAGDSDMTVVAQWTRRSYIVSVDSLADGGRAATDFENPVAYGDTVMMTAQPYEGYHFVSWNDGDAVNPRSVVVTSDTSFSPLFEVNSHLLYIVSDGVVKDSLAIAYGDTITDTLVKRSWEKVGYDFTGWSPELPVVAGDSDMTVTAQWVLRTFIVKYDSLTREGSIVTNFENPVPYGTFVTLEAVPNVGYHFVAWTDGVSSNPHRHVVYKDTSFVALYEPNQYMLYVMNGEDTLRKTVVLFGDTVTESLVGPAPVQEGYDFVGWSLELPFVVDTADVTVSAQFTKKNFIFTIDTIHENGGVVVDFENPVAYGDTVTVEAVPSEGYHFVAWSDSVLTNPRRIVVVSDTSLVPIFEVNQYYLTVLSDADTLKRAIVSYGDSITTSTIGVTPVKEGHDFVGWQPAVPLVMGAADLTVVAQFQRKTFEFTLDTLLDHGTVIADFLNPVAYGDVVSLEAVPSEGYHFVAWSDSVTVNPRDVVVTSDTALIPLFEPNLYYLIVMNEDTIVETRPVHYGDTVQESSVTVSLEKIGHDFAGWSPSLPITVGVGDVTIVAQWTKKLLELTLDTLFERGKIFIDSQNPVTYGDSITLTAEPFEGYHFLSWADGDTLNPRRIEVVSDTALVPVFMPNTYVFAALLDGDTLLKFNVTYGDSITDSLLSVIPEKVGHDFTGWYPSLPIKVGAEDFSVEAQWVRKTYNVEVYASENGRVDHPFENPVAFGDTITFSAFPDEGFRFSSWADGDRSNPRSVVVTGDSSFTSTFVPNVYNVAVISDNDTLAILPYLYRDTIQRRSVDSLRPTKVGHDFVGWNVDFPLSMDSHDTSIVAIYTPKIFSVITKINGNVGKVSGNGEYPYGSIVSLQAIPNEGFHFVKWGDGDTASTISFIITSDTIVSTLFAMDIDEMMVDTLIIPSFGYCPNTEDVIRYSLLNSEAPTEYRIIFSEEARQAGFVDIDFTKISADNEVKIVIPDCPADVYRASIQFKNAINSVTPFFDVDLRVNLSSDYIIDIWRDVVSAVNTENIFLSYQWYHNDVKVGGATSPYYCEKKGLSGNYYLEALTADGRQLRTCKKWFDNATNTMLSVYPNPTADNATVELSVDNGSVHNLSVMNSSGVVLLSTTFVGRKTQVNFRDFPSGAYIVEVDGMTVKEIRK